MQLKLRGKLWTFLRTNIGLSPEAKGDCDAPSVPNKKIRVRASLRGQKELEITIHEMLHACLWDLDEEAVYDSAEDIARALWRLGYRKTTE